MRKITKKSKQIRSRDCSMSVWAKKVVWCVAALVVSFHTQADTYYYHNDQLGTPQVLTDSNQQVVWKGEYDPFGKVTETVNTVEQNLRFPGQYYDQETGLHYNYFRTYDPETGRYVESDPIGLAGGLSTYGYVGANPLAYSDIFGLEKLILVSKGFFTTDRVLYVNAQVFPDKKGTLYIFAHGNHERIRDDREGMNIFDRKYLFPEDLANLLKESDLWEQGNPIELWGCSTAHGGETSFASSLANLLGVPVKGFSKDIDVYDVGPKYSSTMIEFLPKQND